MASPSPLPKGRGLGRGVRIGPWGSAAEEFIGPPLPNPLLPRGRRGRSCRVSRGNFLNSTAVVNPNGIPSLSPAASRELPWVCSKQGVANPEGVVASHRKCRRSPTTCALPQPFQGLPRFGNSTQGSSCLATRLLGWRIQSFWDWRGVRSGEFGLRRLRATGLKGHDRFRAGGPQPGDG